MNISITKSQDNWIIKVNLETTQKITYDMEKRLHRKSLTIWKGISKHRLCCRILKLNKRKKAFVENKIHLLINKNKSQKKKKKNRTHCQFHNGNNLTVSSNTWKKLWILVLLNTKKIYSYFFFLLLLTVFNFFFLIKGELNGSHQR